MPKLKPNQFMIADTLITERPILFSTEMVRANLDGRKTQTRRTSGLEYINEDMEYQKSITLMKMDFDIDGNRVLRVFRNGDIYNSTIFKSPYGKPGDLLWVRETWVYVDDFFPPRPPKVCFKADYQNSIGIKWKPSIHLPKSDARIWLMVEEVRVERLQDISHEDAKAEGIKIKERKRWIGIDNLVNLYKDYLNPDHGFQRPDYSFRSLWVSINGKDSWDANPFVWVIKYRILSKTGRPSEKTIFHNVLEVVHGEKNFATI